MNTRLSRAEASAASRAAVLASARRQFEIHGFHGATLEAIAEDAGFSKGVVYSRFESKDDLFLGVLEENIERRARRTSELFDELAGPRDLRRLAEINIRESVGSMAWQVALLEFRAHAWRSPELNQRYRELHSRTVESISGFIEQLYRRAGQEPPRLAGRMAIIGLASATGAVTEIMADSELDAALFFETFPAALEAAAQTP
ncbi:MAG: TetR/AcrR family transcriptional regulator [Dehalococcoidia bacterium]